MQIGLGTTEATEATQKSISGASSSAVLCLGKLVEYEGAALLRFSWHRVDEQSQEHVTQRWFELYYMYV